MDSNRSFRMAALGKIIAEAKYNSIGMEKEAQSITDTVKKSLEEKKPDGNKPTFTGKIKISAGIPGVSVIVPDNPIVGGTKKEDGQYENGKYNVFVQIRPGSSSTKSGVNSILVLCEAGGMASAENDAAFGNTNWISTVLNNIQSAMTKQFGNVSLGRLGIGNFSGGFSAVGKILSDPKFSSKITDIVSLDGLHYGSKGSVNEAAIKPWLDFAQKAAKDKNKTFTMLHTAVVPENYSSTTDAANYFVDKLGMKREIPKDETTFAGIKPATIANSGNASIVQLYDQVWPYQKDNAPGTMGYQHVMAAKSFPDILNKFLVEKYNTPQ